MDRAQDLILKDRYHERAKNVQLFTKDIAKEKFQKRQEFVEAKIDNFFVALGQKRFPNMLKDT